MRSSRPSSSIIDGRRDTGSIPSSSPATSSGLSMGLRAGCWASPFAIERRWELHFLSCFSPSSSWGPTSGCADHQTELPTRSSQGMSLDRLRSMMEQGSPGSPCRKRMTEKKELLHLEADVTLKLSYSGGGHIRHSLSQSTSVIKSADARVWRQATLEVLQEFDVEAAAGVRGAAALKEAEWRELLAAEELDPQMKRRAYIKHAVHRLLIRDVSWQFAAFAQVGMAGRTSSRMKSCGVLHTKTWLWSVQMRCASVLEALRLIVSFLDSATHLANREICAQQTFSDALPTRVFNSCTFPPLSTLSTWLPQKVSDAM